MAERRPLNVYLSPEAFEAWRLYATAHSVSVSGLIEAIGQKFANDTDLPSRWLLSVVKDASQIDAERRSRGRRER